MAVIRPQIETDPTAIEQIGFDYFRSAFPNWEPRPGDPATMTMRAHARMIAEERDVADDVPLERVAAPLLEKVHRVAPLPATAATADATVTMRDTAGYRVPAGLEVFVATTGDDGVTMAVISEVVVAPGDRMTDAGEVTLRAVAGREGEAGNGLTSANRATVIRSLDYIGSVALVGTSSGGRDAESDEDHFERGIGEVEIASPVPIHEPDVVKLARRNASVYRALAINLYDPVTRTFDNERTVAVALIDVDGAVLGRTVRDEVATDLLELREVNWRFPIIDATYTAIDVGFTAECWFNADPDAVRTAALAALADYLDPARSGLDNEGTPTSWVDVPILRFYEVVEVLQGVPGLRYVLTLGIAREGGRLATADITLDGPAALTRPGRSIAGTVTAP